eukprot:SAG31_NODE_31935_length_362_cov_0.779468_1_plen_35_part_10
MVAVKAAQMNRCVIDTPPLGWNFWQPRAVAPAHKI